MSDSPGKISRVKTITAGAGRWIIAAVAIVVGVATLWASWYFTSDRTGEAAVWWQDVLVNVGAAILLVAPIELVSARLSRRVSEVRGEVEIVREETTAAVGETREAVRRVREETSQSVDEIRREVDGVREQFATLQDLGAKVAARVAAEQAEEEALYRRVGADGDAPDRSVILEALRRARENNVTSEAYGPRVEPHPGSGEYLRLVYEPSDFDAPDLGFEIVGTSGAVSGGVTVWEEGTSVEDVMVEVAHALSVNGIDPAFDIPDWFRRLSETLLVGFSHPKRHGIIELSPPQWAVTDSGVVPYPEHPLRAQGAGVLRTPRSVAAVKQFPWVDADSFDQAAVVWCEIFGATDPWALGDEPPY